MSRLFNVAVGENRHSTNWRTQKVDWEWFVQKCSKSKETHETYKSYLAMEKSRQDEIKDVGGYVAGHLSGARRKKESVTIRSVGTLDADFAGPRFWEKFKMIFGCSALVYSTHKHSPENPRYRLLIPFDRDVTVAEYEPIMRWIAGALGIDQFDRTTYAVERLMYFPSHSADMKPYFREQKGHFLDPDKILDEYTDWTNMSEWPFGQSEVAEIRSGLKKLGDPRDKKGIIGAFCKAYLISEVIDEFLPDVYELAWTGGDGMSGNRYTLLSGSTTGGMIIYDDDLHAYSNHSSDPIGDRGANAFDLVRIHKFGHLDRDCKADTPVTRRPSYLAMIELATADKNVKMYLAEEKHDKAGLPFKNIERIDKTDSDDKRVSGKRAAAGLGGNTEWLADMDVDKKGTYHPTHNNYELILLNDEKLAGKIGFNVFTGRTEVLGELPWDTETDRTWDDSDMALLRIHIGKQPYEMQRSPKMEDAFESLKKNTRFHPIKDYLNSVKWDGKPRMDSLVIDFLGAEDTPYTREVTRKWLLAGCYRIFEPGCKFDEVLVLVGIEREGKSVMFSKLAGKWFTDQFKFHMLSGGGNGKQAFEVTDGKWIVEVSEMAGLSKSDVLDAKSFLSSQIDTFRPSHKAETVDRKRSFIIGGTSNNYQFLQGALGNGRFWPVDIYVSDPIKSVFTDLNQDYVNQLWAEAMEAYHQREPLFLSKQGKERAKMQQIDHEATTGAEGALLDYLNMELPENWEEMTPESRYNYTKKPTSKTGIYLDRVCAAQVWCELYGEKIQRLTIAESMKIFTMMRKMPGWVSSPTSIRFRHYGKQRGFKYVGEQGGTGS